jgi:thiamine biosynthesis protein ThiS
MSTPAQPVVRSQQSVVSILVNGELRDILKRATVLDLVKELGLRPELVAVEVNRELVRRSTFGERELRAGDRIEIVEFVGGG